jgi:hypothetical protein
MYPAFGIAGNSYVFRVPYSEEIKRRPSVFSTNLTMANADADRISLDLESDFAAIAATCPLLHLELLPVHFEISVASDGDGSVGRTEHLHNIRLTSTPAGRFARK